MLAAGSEVRRAFIVAALLGMGAGCSAAGSGNAATGGAPGSGGGGGGGVGARGGNAGAGSGSGGAGNSGIQTTGGGSTGTGGAPITGGHSGTPGSSGGINTGGSGGSGGTIGSGGKASDGGQTAGSATGGATGSVALAVLTDTNRDGAVDEKDDVGFTDWAWKGKGAFFIANMDDDDAKGETDASDQIVNGEDDEKDLARILIKVSADAMPSATSIAVSAKAGATQSQVFEKTSSGWQRVTGPLSQLTAEIELGIEAKQFADANWDGFVTLSVELSGSGQSSIANQEVKMHVAPWIMLPQSAKTELLYISSTTSRLNADLDRVLESVGLPRAAASNPGQQDIWFQDTMEIGYTQLPGAQPMHVVMKAQRPNASDDVAITLLAPDFGFISIGEPRQPGDEEDHWMDWMGNLEVTHPLAGYPLGRIYYGRSERTTFHPTILQFLEAQQVQKPFAVYTNWLVIQHVDEVLNFLADENGKAKMIIASPEAANTVMGSGYDTANREIQGYIDQEITHAKAELGLTDADIIQLPTYFEGSGTDYAPIWSSPVNSVLAGDTFMIGDTGTPDAVKSDVEQKLEAIGIQVAWVDDGEYHPGGGNVHCGTNTKKAPVCADFTACIP
jgi:hypothetical protein